MNQPNIAPLIALHQSVADVIAMANDLQRIQNHCSQLSRIVAGLVAQHGGFIRKDVFDLINTSNDYVGHEIRLDNGDAEIVIEAPILTILRPEEENEVAPAMARWEISPSQEDCCTNASAQAVP